MQAAGPRALRCSTAVIVINTRVHGRHTHTHMRARNRLNPCSMCVGGGDWDVHSWSQNTTAATSFDCGARGRASSDTAHMWRVAFF